MGPALEVYFGPRKARTVLVVDTVLAEQFPGAYEPSAIPADVDGLLAHNNAWVPRACRLSYFRVFEISRNCTLILSDARAVASASVTAPVFLPKFRENTVAPYTRASKAHRPTTLYTKPTKPTKQLHA